MKNHFYDVTRSVYGKETSNMPSIAFGYVPAKKRIETVKAVADNAPCIGEHCNNQLFTRTAVQNG